jgi:cytochrome c oxidase subunit III
MSDSHAKQHDYHLVDPSPWPALASLSAFVTAIGAVMWMHEKGFAVFTIGMIMLLYTAFVWWRDVVKEGEHQGHHTPVVQLGLQSGPISQQHSSQQKLSAVHGHRKVLKFSTLGICHWSTH